MSIKDSSDTRKLLDFSGLSVYDGLIKEWTNNEITEASSLLEASLKNYYKNNSPGSVNIADKASKLNTARKIELVGGVTGDVDFDGSSDVVLSTKLHISGTLENVNITGNAGTATNFASAKPVTLTGDITGSATGGINTNGWVVNTLLSDGAVTNAKLAGGITNDKLVNNSVTLGSTSVSLGGTASTISGLSSVTASAFVGDLTGNASTSSKATSDSAGNNIIDTYATKAELAQAQASMTYKGTVPTRSALPLNPSNGDIYGVEDEGKNYIWSDADQAWSVFGSSYGPATSNTFGLVKSGSNITNTSGTLSLTQSNVDSALGYQAISGVTVNGSAVVPINRVVDISVPTDYATQKDIDDSFTYNNVTTALGFDPIDTVSLNGTPLAKANNSVNIDLSDYATESWTSEQIVNHISSLYKFKGSLLTYGDLLNIQNPVTGDTYNIITPNDPEAPDGNPDWPLIAAGTNFSWDGDEWDSLGGALDFSNYYKKDEVDELLDDKSNVGHNHDDRYYTETETNVLLASKANTNHNHDDRYYTEVESDALLGAKQNTLVSGTNIKTIEGSSLLGSGNLVIKAYHSFRGSWTIGGTIKDFCDDVLADTSAVSGMVYTGTLMCSDFVSAGIPVNSAEAVVRVFGSDTRVITVEITDVSHAPYTWTYRCDSNGYSGWNFDLNSSSLLTTTTGWSSTASDSKVVSEALLKSALSTMSTAFEQYVTNFFTAKEAKGEVNDIRTYADASLFPIPGVKDVQYVAKDTGIEYQWVVDEDHADGGYYMEINKIASADDISNLFD